MNSESPSLLQSLKRFRFKKKDQFNADAEDSINNSDDPPSKESNVCVNEVVISSDDECDLVIIRKRKRLKTVECEEVININSSDSEDGNDKKHKRLKCISDSSFDCDKKTNSNSIKPDAPNDVISNFSSNNKTEVKNGVSKKSHNENSETNSPSCSKISCEGGSKKKKKKRKRKKTNGDENDKSDDEVYREGNVYNSDESDDEITNALTGMRAKVFKFLNSYPEEDLKELRCTQKKVKAIMDARPFRGWRHLVSTCEDNRSIGTDILNTTQSLLCSRKVLSNLMLSCERISRKTEQAISDGATNISEEPSILTPGYKLKNYQMVGLNWLAVMHSQKLSGILADEMGLGKTIQVIAFLAYLKVNGFTTKGVPHLIVVPASTLENWVNELEKWCPSIIVAQYYGSQNDRRQLRYDWVKNGLNDIEVVLSTYQVISGSYEDKKLFRIVSLHYAIFDEGHMLKNMNSQRYENLFRINSKYKLLLTGTPVQNSLLELMSLLMFIMPDMFASKRDFIKYLFEKKTTKAQDQLKFDRENIENAKKIMKPFMLRRLKIDVLQDLPSKTTVVIECPMVESQAIKYAELLERFKNASEDEDDSYKVKGLAMYTDLRRLANHPLALRYLYEDDKVKEMAKLLAGDYDYKENKESNVFEDLLYKSDHELHKFTKIYKSLKTYSLPDSVFLESGKFSKMDELLPELKANNHRLLIFSQFVFILDILEEYLRIREHTFLRIDGSTPVCERQQLIDLFNTDSNIFVFLLTTKAGGMGINLTAADTVIINDVDFNPYNDKQAEDRCHRMGQTKDVKIIRFISKGTIEEQIHKIAQEKANLGQEITAEDEIEVQKNMVTLLSSALGL